MKCPACRREMKTTKAGEIIVDVCDGGCGGIWFDRFEIKKVDERHESAGEALLHVERAKGLQVDQSAKRQCPRCGVVMMRHFSSVKRKVTIDECPKCAGYFLDAGELAGIRDEFTTEAERAKAAEAYFEELFGKDLARMHDQSEAGLERGRKIARMFRFICPSYYLPGKQSWGAF